MTHHRIHRTEEQQQVRTIPSADTIDGRPGQSVPHPADWAGWVLIELCPGESLDPDPAFCRETHSPEAAPYLNLYPALWRETHSAEAAPYLGEQIQDLGVILVYADDDGGLRRAVPEAVPQALQPLKQPGGPRRAYEGTLGGQGEQDG